jgi:hypothetical protein
MPLRRTKFNTKRRFASTVPPQAALTRLAAKVRYGGNPTHKRNPGDFGLTPPSLPRDDKSLCDSANILKRADALKLLKRGVERGMISEWDEANGFPKNVWSVTDDGIPLEAQLENAAAGTYHGYPMEVNDDFRQAVIDKWKQHNARRAEY